MITHAVTSLFFNLQETLEFHEGFVYSLTTGADADAVGNFHEGYEPSPMSVLDSTFSEDISVISECSAAGVYGM